MVTTIPKEKAKALVHKLTETLSGNHHIAAVDMIAALNRQLAGWAAFYKFTDHSARIFQRIDTVVFWKMAHWLGRKYRSASNHCCGNGITHRTLAKPRPGWPANEEIRAF